MRGEMSPQKLFSEKIEGYLFEVYSSERLEIPARSNSKYFSLGLFVDSSRFRNEEVHAFARECFTKGLSYLVAWGPDCERVHDLFDDELIDKRGNDRYVPAGSSSDDVVITTWHANEPLAKALFYFVYCAYPTEVFEREWKHRMLLVIGNENWARKAVRYMKAVAASAVTGRVINDFAEEEKA